MTRYKFNTSVIEALSKEHLDNKNVTEVGIGVYFVCNHGEKNCCICGNQKITSCRKRI